jgi:hypothetical protein
MGLGQQKQKLGGWRPALGFLMFAGLAVVSWFMQQPVQNMAKREFPGIRGSTMPAWQLDLLFAFILFVVLASIAGIIIAIAAPKRAINVREGDIAKERKQMLVAKGKQKRRRQKLYRQRTDIHK